MRYDPKIIGKRIKEGCKNCRTPDGKRLTQEALAEMLNVTRETVSTWATGKKIPTLDTLFRLCDIFNFELGYLLGEPGYENGTRQATDIVNETGLSEDAAYALQKYKRMNTEKSSIDLKAGSVMSNAAQNALDFKKYTEPSQFIPELISFMLTSKSFNNLVKRICAQNAALWEFSILPDVEKEIIVNSYWIALDQLGPEKADNTILMEEEYRRVISEYILHYQDDIQRRLPVRYAPGSYETIFADRMRKTFHLARMTSEQTEEMNAFLISRDLFNIVNAFMEPITIFKD